ncbi:MAG: hypothetical protein [Caudoviricetes sp.]|nr:MAG: hypothetical protein [Caudoviricetes sp.]
MQLAYIVAQESKCVSWKVGAIISKDERIISTGYNGTPAGQPNCRDVAEDKGWIDDTGRMKCECGHEHTSWSKSNEIHAELNAILYAAKRGISVEGATMYVNVSPCGDCAKAIAQSGIRKLVYCVEYPNNPEGWADILLKSDIQVIKLDKRRLNLLNWSTIEDRIPRVGE